MLEYPRWKYILVATVVVLGLLFLKYIEDAFEERREALKAAVANPKSDYYVEPDEREDELAQESRRLAERSQTLNVAEAKLAEQLAAFETARKNLEATLAVADKAAERDIERMTTVYENMKPAEAAKIFERMDVSFAAGLLARVRPEIAAQMLAAMNADSAYAVTLTIASRNHAVPTE